MDEVTKIIREIESQLSGMIAHMENFTVALKKLVPKVIEKKVIVLKNGQIYKCCGLGPFNGTYYLLIGRYDSWRLINLGKRDQSWSNWRSGEITKSDIEKYFTLCPTAKVVVLPKFPDGGSDL